MGKTIKAPPTVAILEPTRVDAVRLADLMTRRLGTTISLEVAIGVAVADKLRLESEMSTLSGKEATDG